MRKHQFIKKDCNCERRATYFACKFCGGIEYSSPHELQAMDALHATCPSAEAPVVSPAEKMKAAMGGFFDCLEG